MMRTITTGGVAQRRSSPSSGYSSGPRKAGTYQGRSRFGGNRPFSRGGASFNRGGNRPMRGFGNARGGARRTRGEHIDHARFIYTPPVGVTTPAASYVSKHTFADLKLSAELQRHISERGFERPTAIQDQVIMHALEGKDVIGLAQTGSGKTAAFLIPLIEKAHKDRSQKILILAPTRELAQQINKEMRELSHGMHLFSTVCVGGTPMFRNVADVRRSNHFIIATPGRLKDLAKRKALNLGMFQSVVLDEVDRMLDMGFITDITEILKQLPETKQSLVFSATMPPKIKTLVHTFLKNPITVELSVGNSTKNVAQNIVQTRSKEEKFAKLCEILKQSDVKRTIVFTDMKHATDKLAHELSHAGFTAQAIHGDKRQRERERTLRDFKEGRIAVLVATDVAARGIDVNDVTHVINYTIPQTHDDYVHRIGRTGRGTKTGVALTFV